MKLKTLVYLNEWISHAPTINRSPDSQLRPTPGGLNDDSPNWDGVTEGKGWFCYVEANDWHNKLSGASVYITEDEKKPVKLWIKIKTHGLRKNSDTNESHIKRIRKHADKVAGAWMSAAKKIHNNPELNEAGNPLQKSWKESFMEALDDPKVKSYLKNHGEVSMDPVNFTPRI